MRTFAVSFADDPEGSLRLVMAQAGRAFMVGRLPHDPPGPGAIWFEFGDDHGAVIVAHFTSDIESWGRAFNPPEASPEDEVIG